METTINKKLNGVDVTKLSETIDTIAEQPTLGKAQFRARNKWISGGHNRTTIQDFFAAGGEDTTRVRPHVLDADEPEIVCGTDKGANPVEYVLTALAACVTTSMVYHAAKQGIQIEELESELVGDLDIRGFFGITDEVRNGYENIQINFKVKSDAPAETLKELCKFSPVFDIVTNPVPVSLNIEKK